MERELRNHSAGCNSSILFAGDNRENGTMDKLAADIATRNRVSIERTEPKTEALVLAGRALLLQAALTPRT